MTADRATLVAEALGAHLESRATANTYGISFDVEIRHSAREKRSDLSGLRVFCIPRANAGAYSAKRMVQNDIGIDVQVQVEADPSDETTWRQYRRFVEQIQDDVASVAIFPPGKLLFWENDPLFLFVQAKETHVFVSITRFVFRAHKEL